MSAGGRPAGLCFDYGNTLVELRRPLPALVRAGQQLAPALPNGGSDWAGTAGELALALDELVDQLVDQAHAAAPETEVEITAIYCQALERLLGRVPSPELVEVACASTQRAWVEGVTPVDAARPVLAELRRRGMRLGLCSNAPYPGALMREQLEILDLSHYFDATLFSSEIGWRKPAPQVFAEMLTRLHLPASRVWFVGDDWEADIKGACRAGMRAILAPGAGAGETGAEQLGCWGDLLELAE